MNMHSLIAAITSVFLIACAQAAEEFKMPAKLEKALIGEWKIVKVGKGDEMQELPEEQAITMIMREDGSGEQVAGEHKFPMVWGADANGAFATQLVFGDRKGDGTMGTWEMTDEGLLLRIQFFRNSVDPGDLGTMLLKKVGD